MTAVSKVEVIRQLIGRFGVSSGLVVGGRLSILLLFLIAARFTNSDQFGLFVFAMAASQVLALVCSVGTAPASQLIIGEARGRKRLRRIPSFIRFALAVTVVMSSGISLLFGVAGLVATSLDSPTNASQLLFATSIFVPVMSLSTLREYIARAMELVVLAFVPRDILWSVCFAIAILLVPIAREHLVLTGAVLLLAIELPLWVILWRLIRRRTGAGRDLPCKPYRRWTSRSAAMMTNFLAGLGFERVDVLMMGALSPLTVAGIYGAASRIAPLISTSQRFIIPILSPKVAEALSVADTSAASREVYFGVTASSLIAIPATLFVLLFAPHIMALFGPQFVEGANALRILSAAHLAIAIGSNFSVPIMVSKRAWLFARIIWTALLPTAAVMPLSIYLFGSVGAAVTVAVGIMSYNLVVIILSRRILRP